MTSEAACELCGQPISAAVGRSKHLHLGTTGKDVDLCSDCYIATGDGADEEFLEFLLSAPKA
ncbi:MAG: hypothetical protein ACE5LS_02555 [Thermoplasmata archaeon]